MIELMIRHTALRGPGPGGPSAVQVRHLRLTGPTAHRKKQKKESENEIKKRKDYLDNLTYLDNLNY